MKWIITGGCGFIGSNIAQRLKQSGGEPIVIDNISRPRVIENRKWLKQKFSIDCIQMDILDKKALFEVFSKHSDASGIIHLAGQVSLLDSISHPRKDFEINAIGTLNILECMSTYLPNSHLVFTSSNKVYGDLLDIEVRETNSRFELVKFNNGIDETFRINPKGGYGVSKFSAELLINDWAENYKLKCTILRQSSVYGERQFPTSDQGWATYFTEQFIDNKDFHINGNGKQVRDLLYVGDFYNLINCIFTSGADAVGTFNVGGGQANSSSLLELFETLQTLTGNSPIFTKGPIRNFDQKVFISDNSLISSRIGWKPTVNYHDGLQALINWLGFYKV